MKTFTSIHQLFRVCLNLAFGDKNSPFFDETRRKSGSIPKGTRLILERSIIKKEAFSARSVKIKHPLSLFTFIGTLFLTTNLVAAPIHLDSTQYQLLTVDLAVRGETFTGTIVEKKEQGYFPLAAGSLVSIQGQVVTTKAGGRVDIPPPPAGECSQDMPVEILFDGLCRDDLTSIPSFRAPPITIIPSVGNGITKIHTTTQLIKPGSFFTATGQGLDQIQSGGLRAANGDWIAMKTVAGSSVQQKYMTPANLPEGSYQFEALGANGDTYEAPTESIYPSLEMSGPSLRKIRQKGKIKIRANTAGTLTVWGGMPQIELIPEKNMRTGINADGRKVILIDTKGNEWIEIPFIARMIGQYNVTAELRTPEEAKEEYETDTQCDLLSVNSHSDFSTGVTDVTTELVVQDVTTGQPVAGLTIEAIVAYPGGMEVVTATSNSAGMVTAETELAGNWPKESITVTAFRTAGNSWQQEPLFSANTVSLMFNLNDEGKEDNKAGNDEALAEIYRENKRRWGNYQGICGTAIFEMCTLYPKLCENFKKTEVEIEEWLRKRENESSEEGIFEQNNQDENEATDMDFDADMADVYRANKRRWGNYSGICGTALMEMARHYPKLYEEFLKNEAAIDKWLNSLDEEKTEEDKTSRPGSSRQDSRSADNNLPRQIADPDTKPDQSAQQDNQREDEKEDDGNPIPEEDRAELEDGAVKRAFEENEVTALRILDIKLGYMGAAVTKIGDEYYITYQKRVVFDPETGRPINYWDFNKAKTLTPDEWYAIYLLSLGTSPLNMLARIVESAESLGSRFLDDLFKDMKEKNEATRFLEVQAEHLMLLYVTASFEQGAMPQLGDHYRDAEKHMEKAAAAAEQGDWMTALQEWEAAKTSMAWLALEVMPGAGGTTGKTAGRTSRRVAKPLVEVAENATRNLDEVAETLRKAAKSETNPDIARQMSRRADAVEEMAEKSKKLNRITDISKPRPSSFPVAAKDRTSLEECFGKNKVETVGRRKPENVLMVTDANGNKQVWVRPEYSDYKGAYEAVHGQIPRNLDVNVDHLQSRARAAQQEYGYVRLELVNSDVNQAWGRHMEKRTVNAGRHGHVEPSGPAPIRHIDQFQWWKLQGISPERVESAIKGLGK